jgi:hypothetical protein
MTTPLVIAVVAGVLACPLRMLWTLARRRRPSCMVSCDGRAGSVTERQRRLAAGVRGIAATRDVERLAAPTLSR